MVGQLARSVIGKMQFSKLIVLLSAALLAICTIAATHSFCKDKRPPVHRRFAGYPQRRSAWLLRGHQRGLCVPGRSQYRCPCLFVFPVCQWTGFVCGSSGTRGGGKPRPEPHTIGVPPTVPGFEEARKSNMEVYNSIMETHKSSEEAYKSSQEVRNILGGLLNILAPEPSPRQMRPCARAARKSKRLTNSFTKAWKTAEFSRRGKIYSRTRSS